MINHIRFIWQLLVLFLILVISGTLVLTYTPVDLPKVAYLVTAFTVATITLVSYLIMMKGISRNSKDGLVFLLGGIGAKFLLYLIYILAYWLATKNLTKPFIITFFTLYLIYTFFLAGHLLKSLKNK